MREHTEGNYIKGVDFTIKNIPRSIKIMDPKIDIKLQF
jgi:hypothetical protein